MIPMQRDTTPTIRIIARWVLVCVCFYLGGRFCDLLVFCRRNYSRAFAIPISFVFPSVKRFVNKVGKSSFATPVRAPTIWCVSIPSWKKHPRANGVVHIASRTAPTTRRKKRMTTWNTAKLAATEV